MIIAGGARSNRFFFAKHLTNAEQNEKVRIAEIKGFASKTPHGCFREMELIASATKVRDYFYHADINPQAHEKLTEAQWEEAVDRLEKELGLEGQQRFVVEHEKKGRVHRHAVWLRIDVFKMTGIPHPFNFRSHQRVAKQLEKDFGLEQVVRPHLGELENDKRPERNLKPWETFRGQESGIDPIEMKQEISELWNGHDKGQAFVDALEGRGYLVARGDSRNYCIVDQAGDVHSLARRLPRDVKAADVREKLKGIDPKSLPHVKEAAAYQKSRFKETDRGEAGKGQIEGDQGGSQSAGDQEEKRRQNEIEKEQTRQQKAVKDEEQRIKEAVKHEDKIKDQYKEQVEKETELAKKMEAQHRQYISFRQEMDRRAEEAKKNREAKGPSREEGGIRNADTRYSIALGDHYRMESPYSSLSRVSMAEYSAFVRDRERLTRQIAAEKNPDERQKLELQKDIESAEYMAITSRRIGRMSEITQGKDAPETVRQYERADQFKTEAQALRKEYRELSREGGRGSDDPPQTTVKQKSDKATQSKAAQEDLAKSLKVELRNPRVQPNTEEKLVDYVRGLPEKEDRRTFTKEELRSDPAAKKAERKYSMEDRQRAASLKAISRDLKTGRKLNKEDIKDLSKEDLKGIAQNGDSHLKNVVKQHELDRDKGRSRGR